MTQTTTTTIFVQTAAEIADLLRGAADWTDRSPYPLVEAAERQGIDFEGSIFALARGIRDHLRTELEGWPYAFILLEAAQRLDKAVGSSRKRKTIKVQLAKPR